MEKDKLAQYRELKRELKVLEMEVERIEKTDIVTDKVQASNVDFPYQPINLSITGRRELTDKEKFLRDHLNSQLQRAFDLRIEIEDYIKNIEDSRIRTIFRLRYIEDWSWLRISIYLGSRDESYSRKMHDRWICRKNL